jgi:mannitol/fructose-specific phosphotransferase system IIA component (Ntr-type)
MITDWLQKNSVLAQIEVSSSTEAIEKSGQLLVDSGCAEPKYITAMLENFYRNGNYIVMAPGIAVPHASPGPAVLRPGLSLLTLKKPIHFGHPKNDPVNLVAAFCAVDHQSHLGMLMDLAALLERQDKLERMRIASSKKEILKIVSEDVEESSC